MPDIDIILNSPLARGTNQPDTLKAQRSLISNPNSFSDYIPTIEFTAFEWTEQGGKQVPYNYETDASIQIVNSSQTNCSGTESNKLLVDSRPTNPTITVDTDADPYQWTLSWDSNTNSGNIGNPSGHTVEYQVDAQLQRFLSTAGPTSTSLSFSICALKNDDETDLSSGESITLYVRADYGGSSSAFVQSAPLANFYNCELGEGDPAQPTSV